MVKVGCLSFPKTTARVKELAVVTKAGIPLSAMQEIKELEQDAQATKEVAVASSDSKEGASCFLHYEKQEFEQGAQATFNFAIRRGTKSIKKCLVKEAF